MSSSRRRVAFLASGILVLAAPALVQGGCGGESSPRVGVGSSGTGGAPNTPDSSSSAGATASSGAGVGGSGEWTPIPGGESCPAAYMLGPPDWPKRIWASCGQGCLTAPASTLDNDANPASRYGSGAKYQDGEIYMRTNMRAYDGNGWDTDELNRLSDGRTLAVGRYGAYCSPTADKKDAPFLFEFFGVNHDPSQSLLSVFDPKTMTLGKFRQFPTYGNASPSWFTWNDGWGTIKGFAVLFDIAPDGSQLDPIYQGSGLQLDGTARGDLVIWTDWSASPTSIRRWTKALGVGALYQPPNYDIAAMAQSDEAIAWVGVTGYDTAGGFYDWGRTYWAARSATSLDPVAGPELTNLLQGQPELAVAGDYVVLAVGGTDKGVPSGLAVIQMSTQKHWFIAAADKHFFQVAAASPAEALVQELWPSPGHEFRAYRRYNFADLDALADPWP